ncbi:YcdB/YcdC domain-containing protein [Brevibacillus brevis]|uniref:YcdB/YcdC domain-containing protein n=1 Tax=Brevibacillus brevis TaxID=1393 RepID=UPI00165D48DC|nr:YcdB/YcdC domain-containing protein [Brevibacillus brevis]
MMKKITHAVFLLMAASIAMSSSTGALARENTLEKIKVEQMTPEINKLVEKGVKKAASLIPYLKDYPVTEVVLKDTAYLLVNNYKFKENTAEFVSLVLDKNTGDILEFGKYELNNHQSQTLYPIDKSKEAAVSFMKKWYGEDMAGYQLDGDGVAKVFDGQTNTIQFVRVINGVPFPDDMIQVQVDHEGQITGKSLGMNIEKISFAKLDQILSKEKAEKQLSTYMKLRYSLDQDGKTYKLLYVPAFSGQLDAVPGKDKDSVNMPYHSKVNVKPKGTSQLVAKSREEAQAYLTQRTGYDFAKGKVFFEDLTGEKPVIIKYFWKTKKWEGRTNYSWRTDDGWIGSMLIEPKTGSIVSYHVIDTSVSKTATKKLTQEQALQLAINELAEITPAGTGELLLLQPGEYDESTNQYDFFFVRQEQEIPVEDWLTHISINGSNGKVMGIDLNEKVDGVMSDPKKAISPEEATASLLKKYPLQLEYILQEEGKAALVYTLPMLFDAKIDALTGEFYSYGSTDKK